MLLGLPNSGVTMAANGAQRPEDVPADANEHCPGTQSEEAGKSASCQGCPNQQICATAPKGPDPDVAAVQARLAGVKHIVLVLSGKGGVGKSTFAAQLAFALAARGKEVGLLDIDICGPSVPKMLGLEGEEVHQSASGWSPVYVQDNLGVMSIGFMLSHPDDAVIWRGPRKNSLIKQFLKDVDWGQLDYLVVDAPPGTSDEHISIAQLLKGSNVAGAVVVTTPQDVAIIDVRKEITFCRKVGLPVLGVVENMSGLQAPASALRFFASPAAPAPAREGAASAHPMAPPAAAAVGQQDGSNGGQPAAAAAAAFSGLEDATERVHAALRAAGLDPTLLVANANVFHASKGGAQAMCSDMGVPFLGAIPLDTELSRAAEEGRSVFEAGQGEGGKAAGPPPRCLAALWGIIDQLLRGTAT